MISDQDLSELKERCKYAAAHGFQVGLAEQIAAELEDEAGEVEFEGTKHSAAHLVALATSVEEVRSGGGSKKPKAMAMGAKLQAKSEAKVEPEAKIEADPFPSQSSQSQGSSKKSKKKDDD